MDTIAHYLVEDIKLNQDFMYRQITELKKYRSIVIGDFKHRENERLFPFPKYVYIGDIKDWPSFIKKWNIKAIHAHKGNDGAKILPIAQKYHIPLITSFRGQDGSAIGRYRKYNKKLFKHLAEEGALFLPVCHYFKEQMTSIGFPPEKIKVLYGGIDLKRFSYRKPVFKTHRPIRILSVGRLVEKKGFPVLVRAFAKVHEEFPNSELTIIGHSDQRIRSKLERKIKHYQLEHAVSIKEPLNNSQIAKEMRNSDLFCLASHTSKNGNIEGIPNVLKEAMASGLPVISTWHAGIPELIRHEESGLLVEELNSTQLAKEIKRMILHPELWTQFSIAARKTIDKQFNLRKQIEHQEQLYATLLSGK